VHLDVYSYVSEIPSIQQYDRLVTVCVCVHFGVLCERWMHSKATITLMHSFILWSIQLRWCGKNKHLETMRW